MSPSVSTEKTKAEHPSQQVTAEAVPRQAARSGAAASRRAAHAPEGLAAQFNEWVRVEGAWWAASFVFHTLLMAVLMLVPHTVSTPIEGETTTIEGGDTEAVTQQPQLERFEVGHVSETPGDLTTDSLTNTKAPEMQASSAIDVTGQGVSVGNITGATGTGPSLTGLSGFSVVGLGPGPGRVGRSGGAFGAPGGGSHAASGPGVGFQARVGLKKSIGSQGGTKGSERSVAAALSWIARHQSRDGSWSLAEYRRQCKDSSCSGPGTVVSNSAATALALLPFFAAGQTHETKGPYRKTIYEGLYWLMRNQKRWGDLSGAEKPESANMYAHGLATITLCEAYGLTRSRVIGKSAQAAVNFIQSAQHPGTGGWRYTPGQEGDTSVVGWQVMSLKSAQMAGLQVSARAIDGAKRWLKSCAKGKGGQFCYTPESGPTSTMTAVGLLCLQYMGLKRTDPQLVEGISILSQSPPDKSGRNLYYWYYATQVMHNVSGPDWDNWNRRMRRALTSTQCKEGCATGSWDPDKPTKDALSDPGGRLLITSLSALTLEVYYRYLPLYKLDNTDSVRTLAVAPPTPPLPAGKPSAPPPPPPKAPKAGEAPAKAPAPAAKPAAPAPAPAAKPAAPAPAPAAAPAKK